MKKKLLMIVGVAALAYCAVPARAADVSVAVSTYPVNEAATLAAQISGAAKVEKLVISNSSSTPTMVTVYRNCGSTMTVTALFRVAAPAHDNVVLDFTNYNLPLAYSDICFRKSDAVDYIYVSAHYR